MTQVVNGYLAWSFASFEVRVISSRDGSTGIHAWVIFLRALARLVTLRRPDVNLVVVHLSQGGSFVREGLLLRLASARGFATVAHIHGSSFVDYAARAPHRVRRVLQAASRTFVLSEQSKKAAARFVNESRIRLVSNAVPAGFPRPKERRIVFGGAVTHRKGVDVLVAAWQAIEVSDRTALDGWTLDVAGPVVEPSLLVDPLHGVTVHGALPHSRLMELLERSEIAVLPSRDEAMPMFILEALARDACVIATRVGGIPAVLAGGAGVMVDPGDVDGLARELRVLLSSREDRDRLRQLGGLRFRESFSAESLYPQLEEQWADAMENGRGSRSSSSGEVMTGTSSTT